MGKSLKGRELGENIYQQKDGLYVAKYTPKGGGKRVVKRFKKLNDCREWMAEANFNDRMDMSFIDITVDELAKLWIEEKRETVKYNSSIRNEMNYNLHIKPYIGKMKIREVKRIHCQRILLEKRKVYKKGTINLIKSSMSNMFRFAVKNGLIDRNPTQYLDCNAGIETEQERRVMTVEEQKQFVRGIKGTKFEKQFLLILNTGLRIGEICGLQWKDIDFKNKTLKVQRTAYRKIREGIVVDTPKTINSYRTIPLTDEAISILKMQKDEQKIYSLENDDFVFKTIRGGITYEGMYAKWLEGNCANIGVEKITPHTLRHTFATRCIEAGMKPKTLQKILGHSNINMTMNLYVHVTDDEKAKEMEKFEKLLNVM